MSEGTPFLAYCRIQNSTPRFTLLARKSEKIDSGEWSIITIGSLRLPFILAWNYVLSKFFQNREIKTNCPEWESNLQPSPLYTLFIKKYTDIY